MPATPARVALSLNDGVLLSKVDTALKDEHPNAVGEDNEIESFFDARADAQVLLDERWAWKSAVGRPRELLEFTTGFGLGTSVALTPALPRMTITDETRAILAASVIVRAYAVDYNSERYAAELVG